MSTIGDMEPTVHESPQITEEQVFSVLANRRRRYALHCLLGSQGQLEIGDIADQVAAWENDTSPSGVTAEQRKRVYTALQQNHLPQMDDLGVIRYDHHRGTVETTDSIDELDIYLEVVRGRDIPWSKYYLGLAGLSLSLTVATSVGVSPLTSLPASAWTVFVAVAFAVSAFAHTLHNAKLGSGREPPEVEHDESFDEGFHRPT